MYNLGTICFNHFILKNLWFLILVYQTIFSCMYEPLDIAMLNFWELFSLMDHLTFIIKFVHFSQHAFIIFPFLLCFCYFITKHYFMEQYHGALITQEGVSLINLDSCGVNILLPHTLNCSSYPEGPISVMLRDIDKQQQ